MSSQVTGVLRFAGLAVAFVASSGGNAVAQPGFETYGSAYRAFSTPPVGIGSFAVAGAALADGRLIAATGSAIFVETGVGTGAFALAASIDPALLGPGGTTDPAFLAVSPDGSTVALGAGFGRPVVVFGVASLAGGTINSANARAYNVEHSSGAFASATQLALAAGSFGSPSRITVLDITSPVGTPINTTVVANIGGASAGVAFDGAGRLFTANGFDLGPGGSSTGTIRAFGLAEWTAALSGTPIDFESSGVLVGEVLSAATLAFDPLGNLFVGGGDYGSLPDNGYFAVVSAAAIAQALGGGGPLDPTAATHLRRLDPTGLGFSFFGGFFNALTGELVMTDGTTWYATVPAPAAATVLGALGLAAGRRRRA